MEKNNQYEEQLIEQYSEIIKNHKKYLNQKINRIISEKTNQINPTFIERLVDKYLSLELEYTGIYTINQISEELEKAYESVSNELNNDSFDKSKLFNLYKEKIKKTLELHKMTWINNVTDDFIKLFIDETKLLIKDNENLIKDINKSLKDIFSEYKNIFHEEYQKLLREYISKHLEEIKKLFSNSKMDESEKNKLKEYSHIIELSNFKLVESNGYFYLKDKSSNEQHQVIFSEDKLKSTDNKICFIIDNEKKHHGYIDNRKNIRIIIHNNYITLMALTSEKQKKKIVISLSKMNHEYKFYYNSKEINNISTIEIIIKVIEQKAPGIYDKLIYDLDFGSILMQIKNHHKQQAILNIINRTKKEVSESNDNIDLESDSKTPKKK